MLTEGTGSGRRGSFDICAAETGNGRQRFAFSGVLMIAGIAFLVLVFCSSRYGFHGDELYFMAAGRRPSFGYADQGPVLPFLSRFVDLLPGDSLIVHRLPGIALTAGAIILCAAIAYEFGGARPAQLLAAAAYATSPFLLHQAKVLSTNTVSTALWVLITWLLVRWVRTRNDSLLVWCFLATALEMQVKWLIPLFWVSVAVGVLIFGPRDLFRKRQLWLGALCVGVVMIPSLIWQARNGWPQLTVVSAISEQNGRAGALLARAAFVPMALFYAGLLGAILLIYGMWRLFRSEQLKDYRFIGCSLIVMLTVFVVVGGTPYYAEGMYGVVIAIGSVELVERAGRLTRAGVGPVIVLSAFLVLWFIPWRSEVQIDSYAERGLLVDGVKGIPAQLLNYDPSLYGEFGWRELTAAVAEAYGRLSEEERKSAVIVTDTYWQASAIDQYGPDNGLPSVYSPMRGFGYFGSPAESARTILYVGNDDLKVHSRFESVVPVGYVSARLGRTDSTHDITIWKCTNPVSSWSDMWAEMTVLDK